MRQRLEKATELAKRNGWNLSVTREGDVSFFTATREDVGDGYPHTVMAIFEDAEREQRFLSGEIGNNYGQGTEWYELGFTHLMGVLENVVAPFKYKPFYEAFLNSQPEYISEKEISARVGFSERQIRNARIMGYLDDRLADHLCIKLLGLHPCSVYGFGAWVEGVDKSQDPDATLDQRIKNLYESGYTLKEVGEMLHLTGAAVNYRLQKMGVPRRSRGRRKKDS